MDRAILYERFCMKEQKIRNTIPYLVFAVFCAIILTKPFGSGDELWNYSFAKNIVNGLVPYRDFSIVQTPLSAYIPALLMTAFGDGLLVFRIAGFLLLFVNTSIVYHLCKKSTGSAFLGFIAALFINCVNLPSYIYNYNYLSAFVILLIFEIETGEKSESSQSNILVGLLTGTLLLIKQNTGAMLMLANFAVCVTDYLKNKTKAKPQAARIAASAVPIILFSIYMLAVGAMDDFVDYAVVGVTTFVHRTTPLELIQTAPFYLIYIAFILYAFASMVMNLWKDGVTHQKISGLSFAAAWMMVTYPLFDASHLVCVFIVLVPAFCIFVKQKEYKLWEKVTCVCIALAVSALSVAAFLPLGEGYIPSTLNNYEHIPIDRNTEEYIRSVCEYIEQKNEQGYRVRISDDSAAAFMLPLDAYEKNWSMLLVGNIGTNTVEDLLASNEDCLYLVYKYTEDLGSQNHFEMIEYIKANYVKVEEVFAFDVYQKGAAE